MQKQTIERVNKIIDKYYKNWSDENKEQVRQGLFVAIQNKSKTGGITKK